MSQTMSVSGDMPPNLIGEAALQRLRAVILSGSSRGRLLLALRQVEASIGRAQIAAEGILTAAAPARVHQALGSLVAGALQALDVEPAADPQARLQRLQAAWSTRTMPQVQRPLFERLMVAGSLQERLSARWPELA
ncbi:MAG TPA: hypothetical protein VES73_15795, partial [Lamprocystis sp. (in: g-proteobacteria)]|nr:hypothetical protein [Lamprocystis sp. (in: g-proteobacteria)]